MTLQRTRNAPPRLKKQCATEHAVRPRAQTLPGARRRAPPPADAERPLPAVPGRENEKTAVTGREGVPVGPVSAPVGPVSAPSTRLLREAAPKPPRPPHLHLCAHSGMRAQVQVYRCIQECTTSNGAHLEQAQAHCGRLGTHPVTDMASSKVGEEGGTAAAARRKVSMRGRAPGGRAMRRTRPVCVCGGWGARVKCGEIGRASCRERVLLIV